MRSNRRQSRIHTFLFIVLSIALAALASVATFRRATKSSNSEPAPAARGALGAHLGSGKSFRAGRSL